LRIAGGLPMSAGIPPLNVDLAREADLGLGALEVRPSRREIVCGEDRSVLEGTCRRRWRRERSLEGLAT